MTPSIETSIWLALKAHLRTIQSEFKFAWPGEGFTIPHDETGLLPYWRVGYLSVAPVAMEIAYGKLHLRTGTLIVTLVHPMGGDVAVFNEYAGQMAQHFTDGLKMRYGGAVCVEIPNYPHVMDGYEDSGYWTVPVSIPWRCFA